MKRVLLRWSLATGLTVTLAIAACAPELMYDEGSAGSSAGGGGSGATGGTGGSGGMAGSSGTGGSGTGGSGTGGSSASSSSSSGSGGCMPATCPGTESYCTHKTCTNGMCGFMYEPTGTKIGPDAVGDCRHYECNSGHALITVGDATDPYFDGNECTVDACNFLTPENTPLADETPCPNTMGAYCCTSMFCDLTPTGIACRECHPNVPGSCTNMDTPVCQKGKCVPTHCENTMKDADEGGPDCGGSCALCADGIACTLPTDCESQICTGTPKTCAVPSCSDNKQNGKETGVDCGGPDCPNKCTDGLGCVWPSDCESGVCIMNLCKAPTCSDGVQNGTETDVDCGGSCSPCP